VIRVAHTVRWAEGTSAEMDVLRVLYNLADARIPIRAGGKATFPPLTLKRPSAVGVSL
jgi:hypothetical protein